MDLSKLPFDDTDTIEVTMHATGKTSSKVKKNMQEWQQKCIEHFGPDSVSGLSEQELLDNYAKYANKCWYNYLAAAGYDLPAEESKQ